MACLLGGLLGLLPRDKERGDTWSKVAVPVWQPALTNHDRAQIERVQKTALSIILGKNYGSYRNALDILEMDTLEERRKSLCLKFALKASVHPTFKTWFKEVNQPSRPRRGINSITDKYEEPYARTDRFEDSAIPYLTRLLNEHNR